MGLRAAIDDISCGNKKNKALALSDSLNTETVVGHSNSWRKNVRQGRGDYKGLKVRKMIGMVKIGQSESP